MKEMPETPCRKGFQVNNSPKGYNLNNRGFHPRKNAGWFSNPGGVECSTPPGLWVYNMTTTTDYIRGYSN